MINWTKFQQHKHEDDVKKNHLFLKKITWYSAEIQQQCSYLYIADLAKKILEFM